jgi:site-specific DNA-methyltransferase (adenine-specific)
MKGSRGLLIEGDCLERLQSLAGAASDRFDLVYVDPPFNAGGVRAARTVQGSRARGTAAYKDNWGGLDAFLQMLEPRLVAIRDVMSDCGSLWLHLDHRAVHDAKIAADRVFGRSAFRGEIIWLPGNGGKNRRGPSVTHQTILVFARGERLIWNGDDSSLREPYAATSLSMHFTSSDADGRRFRERRIGGKAYRYYADEGRRLGSVWADCPAMRANTPLNRETTGYPTQKPEKLLERIIRAASNPESRVLDPMFGSGTTLAVAQRLGRRWAGIDQSPLAHRVARKRLSELGWPEPSHSERRPSTTT